MAVIKYRPPKVPESSSSL